MLTLILLGRDRELWMAQSFWLISFNPTCSPGTALQLRINGWNSKRLSCRPRCRLTLWDLSKKRAAQTVARGLDVVLKRPKGHAGAITCRRLRSWGMKIGIASAPNACARQFRNQVAPV